MPLTPRGTLVSYPDAAGGEHLDGARARRSGNLHPQPIIDSGPRGCFEDYETGKFRNTAGSVNVPAGDYGPLGTMMKTLLEYAQKGGLDAVLTGGSAGRTGDFYGLDSPRALLRRRSLVVPLIWREHHRRVRE